MNADQEPLLLRILAPGGLDGFFRETCSRPGQLPEQLTPEQINQIALEYGTQFR